MCSVISACRNVDAEITLVASFFKSNKSVESSIYPTDAQLDCSKNV